MDKNMKLSDYLLDVGRPVAYYPKLRRITGSTNATIFICQFIYWTGKESAGDGWIYKTSDEIEDETGLSYKEQTNAREKLLAAGLLSERYARLEHQMYFKVNLEALNERWGTPQSVFPEPPDGKMAKTPPVSSLIESESTTENTSYIAEEKKSKKAPTLKGGLSIENRIAAGLPVEEDNTLAARKELTDSFERALAFNPLQWCSNPVWARFERFVVDELTADPDCFSRFARERRKEGQFSKRMSNEQISRYPDQFIATWPQYRYRKKTESSRTPEEPKHMITLEEMGIV